MNYAYVLALVGLVISCSQTPNSKYTDEILEVEKQFAQMVNDSGMGPAFAHFAAEDAVLKRGEALVIGRQAIKERFDAMEGLDKMTITWVPDFIDVSSSGDLAYTYGHFQYAMYDSNDLAQKDTGVFHTVWKRQESGEWKYVWD